MRSSMLPRNIPFYSQPYLPNQARPGNNSAAMADTGGTSMLDYQSQLASALKQPQATSNYTGNLVNGMQNMAMQRMANRGPSDTPGEPMSLAPPMGISPNVNPQPSPPMSSAALGAPAQPASGGLMGAPPMGPMAGPMGSGPGTFNNRWPQQSPGGIPPWMQQINPGF